MCRAVIGHYPAIVSNHFSHVLFADGKISQYLEWIIQADQMKVILDRRFQDLFLKILKVYLQGLGGCNKQRVPFTDRPEGWVLKGICKCMDDSKVLIFGQTVKRQPLKEDPVRSQPLVNKMVELGGKEDPGIIDPRVGGI